METNVLINLIETVSKTLNAEGFEHIELDHEGTKLVLNKKSVQAQSPSMVTMAQPAASAPATPVHSTPAAKAAEPQVDLEASAPVVEDGNFELQESPIVGTFYNASSPEADTFVQVGDKVKKGDVLCIIEAMKLMNEIESDFDGEIVEILVVNEGPVEYGQPLFKIKL